MKDVKGILVAIMFKEPLESNFSFFDLTAKCKSEFKDLFGKVEPISFATAAENPPPEVPRYILQNKEDNSGEFSFAPLRFDFSFINIKNYSKEYLEDKLETIQSILMNFNLKEFRIGIVASGNITSKEDDPYLKKYLKMESLSDSKEIQFSYRDISEEGNYNVNEWIRYRTLTKSKITNFEYDINTIESISKNMIIGFGDITKRKIGEFIE